MRGALVAHAGQTLLEQALHGCFFLGRNLAVDLKGDGIAVGIYHPGWVQTDMGGSSASITPAASAIGLMARFATLSPATTGCFETWDGRAHPL